MSSSSDGGIRYRPTFCKKINTRNHGIDNGLNTDVKGDIKKEERKRKGRNRKKAKEMIDERRPKAAAVYKSLVGGVGRRGSRRREPLETHWSTWRASERGCPGRRVRALPQSLLEGGRVYTRSLPSPASRAEHTSPLQTPPPSLPSSLFPLPPLLLPPQIGSSGVYTLLRQPSVL